MVVVVVVVVAAVFLDAVVVVATVFLDAVVVAAVILEAVVSGCCVRCSHRDAKEARSFSPISTYWYQVPWYEITSLLLGLIWKLVSSTTTTGEGGGGSGGVIKVNAEWFMRVWKHIEYLDEVCSPNHVNLRCVRPRLFLRILARKIITCVVCYR